MCGNIFQKLHSPAYERFKSVTIQNGPVLNCHECDLPFRKRQWNSKFCSPICRSRYHQREDRKSGIRYAKQPLTRGQKLRNNLNNSARKMRIKDYLRKLKVTKGCADCGYNAHHAALDFDHVRGEKKFNIAGSWGTIQCLREIEKCEVVCSNCHRIRTLNRLEEKRAERVELWENRAMKDDEC